MTGLIAVLTWPSKLIIIVSCLLLLLLFFFFCVVVVVVVVETPDIGDQLEKWSTLGAGIIEYICHM